MTDPVNVTIRRMMREREDAMDFLLIYGRWPKPGEIDAIRQENLTRTITRRAEDAVRPGFRSMLAYWWSQ